MLVLTVGVTGGVLVVLLTLPDIHVVLFWCLLIVPLAVLALLRAWRLAVVTVALVGLLWVLVSVSSVLLAAACAHVHDAFALQRPLVPR
jgi:hypothetical protein